MVVKKAEEAFCINSREISSRNFNVTVELVVAVVIVVVVFVLV